MDTFFCFDTDFLLVIVNLAVSSTAIDCFERRLQDDLVRVNWNVQLYLVTHSQLHLISIHARSPCH